jgi:hypothetical protein
MESDNKKLVRELTKTANSNLAVITDSRKRYQAEGAKNAAAQRLDKLLPQVIEEILTDSRTLVILDNVTKKLDGLNDREDAIVLDFMEFEKKMVNIIFPKNKDSFAFNGAVTDRLNTLLYDHFVKKVNVISMPYLMVKSTNYGTVKTRDAATKKMCDWLRIGYDSEMKSILLRHELYEATKKKLDFDSLTVIVYNVPPWASQSLYNMTGKTVILSGTGEEQGSIAVNDSINDEAVLTQLKAFFSKGETQDEQQQ